MYRTFIIIICIIRINFADNPISKGGKKDKPNDQRPKVVGQTRDPLRLQMTVYTVISKLDLQNNVKS